MKLIQQLRDGKVPGVVNVKYRGKILGDYNVTFVHAATIQLRCIEKNMTPHPIYVPNPQHCPCSIECSADGRTFVTFTEDTTVIWNLTFHNHNEDAKYE